MSSGIPSQTSLNQDVVNNYFSTYAQRDKSEKLVLIKTESGEQKLQIKNTTLWERFVAKFGLNRYFHVANNANLKDVLEFCRKYEITHVSFAERVKHYDEGAWRKYHIIDKIGTAFDSVFASSNNTDAALNVTPASFQLPPSGEILTAKPLTENQEKIQKFMKNAVAAANGGAALSPNAVPDANPASFQSPLSGEILTTKPLTKNCIEDFMKKVEKAANGGPALTHDEINSGCKALDEKDEAWWQDSFPKLPEEIFTHLLTIMWNPGGKLYSSFYTIVRNLNEPGRNRKQLDLYCDFMSKCWNTPFTPRRGG